MRGKSLKSLLAACLIFIMVFSLMACGQDTTDKDNNGNTEDNVNNDNGAQEPVTLTMIQRLNAQYVVEDNPVIKEWEKRLNIKLEIEAPPINNYADRLNIVMASGDLPDIIYLGNTGTLYHGWAKDGLLLQLDEYLEDSMPNAKAVLTEEELAFTRVSSLDNGLYSLPRVQTKPWDNIIYRKDWLDNLELEVPTTPEEFAEVMLAFAKNDPDGNGQNDTFGWSYNRVNGHLHRNLINAFGIRPNSVPDENGNYELMQAQEGYFEYIDWLRGMYESGALDSEWYLTKMYEDDDKWNAGQIGAIYSNKITEHMTANTTNEVKNVDPNAQLVAGPPLREEGKNISDVYYNPQIWGNYGINADSKNIEKAIEFLDYGYTDECNELLAVGLEGVTYTSFDPETRFAIKTKEQEEAASKYTSTYATINFQRQDKGLLMAPGSTEEDQKVFTAAYDDIGAQTNRISYLPEGMLPGINEALVEITDAGLDIKYDEYETKYICGQISREDFVNFIKNEYVPAYEKYMDIIRESGINK